MQRYLHVYGWKHTDFAPFSINAHQNALGNPFARLREAIDLEDYRRARMIASPINLLDASPTGDGSAAVVIVPAERLVRAGAGRPVITITGSASATDTLAVHDRKGPFVAFGGKPLCATGLLASRRLSAGYRCLRAA